MNIQDTIKYSVISITWRLGCWRLGWTGIEQWFTIPLLGGKMMLDKVKSGIPLEKV
jgi:hypothetical protein